MSDYCCCCIHCCTSHFCREYFIVVGLVCGGVIVYITGSIVIFETCQLLIDRSSREELCLFCQQECKKCIKCCVKNNNVTVSPLEPPLVHVMIRNSDHVMVCNPDNSIVLGTESL